MTESEHKPIRGVQGDMREKEFPKPKPIEWSLERRFSHFVAKIVAAIKRGIKATEPYEENWKRIAKQILKVLRDLLTVLAKLLK